MDKMDIKNAQYSSSPEGVKSSIRVTIDGQDVTVPMDESNTHYAEILRQVKEGTLTIKDAD
tara:strand:+ start:1908 stop:2090 length:183 start_codon:yes stop_codon:yes gene_type:complete